MRFFLRLSYRGTHYNGWQIQPYDPSVQETLEAALTKILRVSIDVTGCGRTDTGVHAKGYIAHFEAPREALERFAEDYSSDILKRLNKCLPEDIAVSALWEVSPETHARFDAIHRAYEYHIIFRKSPFEIDTAYHFPLIKMVDFDQLQAAAAILLDYEEFFPFCKTNTQVKTMRCELFRSEWIIDEAAGRMVFHIAANRFLRGMVRLIVGMCLNVGSGKLMLADVKEAMDKQIRLKKDLSVAATGLFLTEVKYPFLK